MGFGISGICEFGSLGIWEIGNSGNSGIRESGIREFQILFGVLSGRRGGLVYKIYGLLVCS